MCLNSPAVAIGSCGSRGGSYRRGDRRRRWRVRRCHAVGYRGCRSCRCGSGPPSPAAGSRCSGCPGGGRFDGAALADDPVVVDVHVVTGDDLGHRVHRQASPPSQGSTRARLPSSAMIRGGCRRSAVPRDGHVPRRLFVAWTCQRPSTNAVLRSSNASCFQSMVVPRRRATRPGCSVMASASRRR